MPHMNLQMGGGHFQSGLSKLLENRRQCGCAVALICSHVTRTARIWSVGKCLRRGILLPSLILLVFLATFARRLVGSIDRSLPEFSSTRRGPFKPVPGLSHFEADLSSQVAF